jgi:carboxymethylenebutenolidase
MNGKIYIQPNIPAYYINPGPAGQIPGIILIHEIWGLVDHIQDVANRLSREGYAVLAPNLFEGMDFAGKVDQKILKDMEDPSTRDETQKKMRTILAPTRSPEFTNEMLDRLHECFDFLMSAKQTNGRVAVMGFCIGGTFSFALATRESKLQAAIPFYGRPPEPVEGVRNISCPILAFYGERETPLMESLPQLIKAMQVHQKSFDHCVDPDSGHAFFNDTNANMYNKEPATDPWNRTVAFLRTHLATDPNAPQFPSHRK